MMPPTLEHGWLAVDRRHRVDALRRAIHSLNSQRALVFMNFQQRLKVTPFATADSNVKEETCHIGRNLQRTILVSVSQPHLACTANLSICLACSEDITDCVSDAGHCIQAVSAWHEVCSPQWGHEQGAAAEHNAKIPAGGVQGARCQVRICHVKSDCDFSLSLLEKEKSHLLSPPRFDARVSGPYSLIWGHDRQHHCMTCSGACCTPGGLSLVSVVVQ